jgi:CheY-like chemotaxis protein
MLLLDLNLPVICGDAVLKRIKSDSEVKMNPVSEVYSPQLS